MPPTTVPETLPLFPLSTVVMPQGRVPLQIFEPRYRQLIKTCIRDGSDFGSVLLRRGSEVHRSNEVSPPALQAIGTRVRIADWFALEHGLLGVVIEGGERFRIQRHWQQADGLVQAEVDALPEPTVVPLNETAAPLLHSLWQDIRRHPELAELGYADTPRSDAELLGALTQVLPLPESEKYRWLEQFGSAEHGRALHDWLRQQGVV